jgi:sialate O-acetylesterase
MTSPRSNRLCTSHRFPRAGYSPILCALLLSLAPLFAQQPPAANSDPSSAAAEHQGEPAGGRGPVLASSEIQQGAILLHFTNADGGLVLKTAGRGAFEIAGADHIWFPAEAHLVNGVVVVSTSLVQQPTDMRYSWSSLAAATLFNRAGVPAAPFRTDE